MNLVKKIPIEKVRADDAVPVNVSVANRGKE